MFVIDNCSYVHLTCEQLFGQIIKKMCKYSYIKNNKILIFNEELTDTINYINDNSKYTIVDPNEIIFHRCIFDMKYDGGIIKLSDDVVD